MENLTDFHPHDYGPVFSGLLGRERLNPLGTGIPISDLREDLYSLTIPKAFAHTKVKNQSMAECCMAGIWLLFNYLDESHTISQGISTDSGSFWHGIMHRRETDFFNSKYWFGRVGKHPIFGELRKVAKELAKSVDDYQSISFLKGDKWNPFDFIDFCEACLSGNSPHQLLARNIQQCEWELLFDYCYHNSV